MTQGGFEPSTCCLGGSHSIHLSYWAFAKRKGNSISISLRERMPGIRKLRIRRVSKEEPSMVRFKAASVLCSAG